MKRVSKGFVLVPEALKNHNCLQRWGGQAGLGKLRTTRARFGKVEARVGLGKNRKNRKLLVIINQ